MSINFGIEANFYFSSIPYTYIGFDLGTNILVSHFSFTPIIGLVFPIGDIFRVFSGIGIEMGSYESYIKGIISDSITPLFNMGLLIGNTVLFKYRLTWYESNIINSIGIGFGFIPF